MADVINVRELAEIVIDTPGVVTEKPVVGGKPEAVLDLEEFREEYPLLRSAFLIAGELLERTTPDGMEPEGIGPTFDELLGVVQEYLDIRVRATGTAERVDVGIYEWRAKVLNVLENAVRNAGTPGLREPPILGSPELLDTAELKRFQWAGIVATGKKCHTSRVPCHTDLERQFADYLDHAPDVERYFKNERFGFSITYYENNRPRQYFADFIVEAVEAERIVFWLAETKGEIRYNTRLKREAAQAWCNRITGREYGTWRYLLVPQLKFESALAGGAKTFAELKEALLLGGPRPQLRLVEIDDPRVEAQRFKTLLPLYSLEAAAGYFGNGEHVEGEGWVDATEIGRLDELMFVARAVGRSMEPRIYDGDCCVFRAKPTGTRQGKIVLAQYRGSEDPETGGSFTVKRYMSEKSAEVDADWRHTRVTLLPENSEFNPIVLTPEAEDDVQIIAELVAVLGRS